MKPFLFSLFCLLLINCTLGTTDQKQSPEPTKQQQITPSLRLFTDTLKKLDAKATVVLDSAVRLYDLLAPADSTGADSAASSLMIFAQSVTEHQRNRLTNDTADYRPLLNAAGNLTDKQKSLSSELHKAKLRLVADGQ